MSNRSKFLMEESTYIPNSIPPALVVFSQPGYGDAMRMQRPFGSQGTDGKDSLNLSTLSSSSFGLRPMDSFAGLPAQLVHLQQNPFLHPALEGRFPFGSSGAFRPIVTSHNTPVSSSSSSNSVHSSGESSSNGGHGGIKNLPSAFTSPTQSTNRRGEISGVMDCRNREQQQEKSAGYMNGAQAGGRHRSPTSPSIKNSSHKEERSSMDHDSMGDDVEDNASPNSDLTDRSSPEETHHPKRRRKGGQETLNCPVCKMSLRPIELESHLLAEVEQLMCMSRLRRSQQVREEPSASTSSVDSPSGSANKGKDATGPDVSQDSRWDTYHRVRANRHSRLRGKTKRRREDSGGPHVTCPVCQVPLQGSNEQFSAHVEACLRKNGDMLDEEDEPVDIEGDGDTHEIEEYGWIGHRRSRASPSTYCAAINMTTNSRRRDEENDSLDVVVDGDDASTYGGVQYTDSDVHLAQAPGDGSSSAQHDVKLRPWEVEEGAGTGEESCGHGGSEPTNSAVAIQVLKGRVRELESKTKCGGISHDGSHCLICMDKYKKPVVSTLCWHVHCENCWLKMLGSKKLCPQCNMITSPGDLRRIFL